MWTTTIVMLVAGLLILMIGKRRTPWESLQTVLHSLVPIIAACAYPAMATGQGLVLLPTGAAVTVVIGAALWPLYPGSIPMRFLSLTIQLLAALTLPPMLFEFWSRRRDRLAIPIASLPGHRPPAELGSFALPVAEQETPRAAPPDTSTRRNNNYRIAGLHDRARWSP